GGSPRSAGSWITSARWPPLRARPAWWDRPGRSPPLDDGCYGPGVPDWYFFGGLAAGAAFLVSRGTFRRRHQEAAADASGLVPVGDLTHLPPSLQRTALWALAEGGFESRVVHGALS